MFKIILALLLITIPTSTRAETPVLDQEDFNLMQSTYDSCKTSPQNTQYECDCAAITFVDRVKAERQTLFRMGLDEDQVSDRLYTQLDDFRGDSYRQCVNRDNVAVASYGECLEWALKTRDDYREFCGCYALRYADSFEQEGTNIFADPTWVMSNAMVSCTRELQRQ